jgi:hypothetical protein
MVFDNSLIKTYMQVLYQGDVLATLVGAPKKA